MSEIDHILKKFDKKPNQKNLTSFFIQMGASGFYPLLSHYDINLVSELEMKMNLQEAKKYFEYFMKNSKNHETVKRKKMFLETRQIDERLLVTKALLTMVESDMIDKKSHHIH